MNLDHEILIQEIMFYLHFKTSRFGDFSVNKIALVYKIQQTSADEYTSFSRKTTTGKVIFIFFNRNILPIISVSSEVF